MSIVNAPAPSVGLARIQEAVRLLAEARTLDELTHIRAMAQAAEEYARAEKLGDEAVRYATEIRVRAARKAGELLKGMAENGERDPGGRGRRIESAETIQLPKLADMGISPDQSSRWQAIAAVPEPDFETAVAGPALPSETALADMGRGRMAVHYTSDDDDWHTPANIIERVQAVLGTIDLDPCSNVGEPNVPAAKHYIAEDNGLAQDWSGTVYMNPPYGRVIDAWVEKLVRSHEGGGVPAAVALVPARTDTAWFRRLRRFPRCFLSGRVRFSGADPAPFPSAAFYLGPALADFVTHFADLGDIFELVTP